MDVESEGRAGSGATLFSPFKGELERVFEFWVEPFSPLKLNSTLVGGMQFSSLQAP